MFAISCPCGCGKTLHLADQMRGKPVACPGSGQRFIAQVETQTCTEATWQRGQDPASVLRYIVHFGSPRKLRLVTVGFCHLHEDLVRNPLAQKALQIVELFADGHVTREEMRRSVEETSRFLVPILRQEATTRWETHLAETMLRQLLEDSEAVMASTGCYYTQQRPHVRRQVVGVMHEIFGNPFDPMVVQPGWLAWHDHTVLRIAQKIYDERQWQDLPILADALEESGCDSAGVLNHLRAQGPHLRGCWALDRVLGLR